jgi:hypothetical protein
MHTPRSHERSHELPKTRSHNGFCSCIRKNADPTSNGRLSDDLLERSIG